MYVHNGEKLPILHKLLNKKVIIAIIIAICIISFAVYYAYYVTQQAKQVFKLHIYLDGKKITELSLDDLKKMCIEKSIRGEVYKAVPLIELLKKYNIDISKISYIIPYGADGYHVQIDARYLKDCYICIMPKEEEARCGKLRFIVEPLSRKYWVKFLVKIVLKVRG